MNCRCKKSKNIEQQWSLPWIQHKPPTLTTCLGAGLWHDFSLLHTKMFHGSLFQCWSGLHCANIEISGWPNLQLKYCLPEKFVCTKRRLKILSPKKVTLVCTKRRLWQRAALRQWWRHRHQSTCPPPSSHRAGSRHKIRWKYIIDRSHAGGSVHRLDEKKAADKFCHKYCPHRCQYW